MKNKAKGHNAAAVRLAAIAKERDA